MPHYTALHRDLAAYLGYYNDERAHTGRLANGRTPWPHTGQSPAANRR